MILRRATAADAPCLHRIRSEASASRYQPLRPYTLARLRAMLETRASDPLDYTFEGKAQWVIAVDGACAGWVTLDVTSREHGVAAVGYTVAEAWRGRGIATAALRQVVDLALDPEGLALERLEAVAAADNLGSRKVLENAGFREEGVAHGLLVIEGKRVDHVRFGQLRDDRQP